MWKTIACLMVFNPTFNNISVISWRSVLLVEEIGEPGENHRPVASHWQLYQIMLYRVHLAWTGFKLPPKKKLKIKTIRIKWKTIYTTLSVHYYHARYLPSYHKFLKISNHLEIIGYKIIIKQLHRILQY